MQQKLFTLLTVLLCATTALATDVTKESELRSAIATNGANITVKADIDLSNSTLSIATGTTVTIDLGGHKLDRHLTQRGEGGGQVITVRSGATLNLSNGTLKGGWGGDSGGISNEGGTVNLTDVTITGCTGDDRGGGIVNRSGGVLNMTGGAITNNTSNDHTSLSGGGGLFNYEYATATLTNVTITGNEAKLWDGGGICNYGVLTLDGVTIQHNTARSSGGGIWSGNEKHNLKMQGANIITDNVAGSITSNLFMLERRWITLTGSIEGSRIGITLDVAPNMFTHGFATYHNGEDPSKFFTCDRPEINSVSLVEPTYDYVGEVIMKVTVPDGAVPYIEHSWDSENKKVVSTTKMLTEAIPFDATPTSETQYKRLTTTNDENLYIGTKGCRLHEYYVVSDEEVNINTICLQGPNVHIILCDKAWLHLEAMLSVGDGETVYIHAQSAGSSMGKWTNDHGVLDSFGGIGGIGSDNGGNIEIHGGDFELYGNDGHAAIGGDYYKSGHITIYDGRIKAVGGGGAAGIGGGIIGRDYGNITIYDGTIDATGGTAEILEIGGGAGIGGGRDAKTGNLTIWGGNITARGKRESAGIGSGQSGNGSSAGNITINGGTIKAYGDSYGAGIGGGDSKDGGNVTINGGRVEAYGGTDAAGIGGGEGGSGGTVTITGGYVYAEGNDNGAGIGGGEDGAGANVTITGGTVIAKAGGDQRAIGAGYSSNSHNDLTFADNMRVYVTSDLNRSQKANRVKDCRDFKYVRINECVHEGTTVSIVDGEKHDITIYSW